LEFGTHLSEHVLVGVVVGLGVLEKNSKLPIQTALDAFAVFGKGSGLLFEIVAFFFGIDMLFKTHDWRNPGWFADESCDVTGYGLDLGEDLNS